MQPDEQALPAINSRPKGMGAMPGARRAVSGRVGRWVAPSWGAPNGMPSKGAETAASTLRTADFSI